MHPLEIRRHLRQQPFMPMRIFIFDGSTYEIAAPDFAFVWLRQVIIGLDPTRSGIPQRIAYIDPVHITRIEPLSNGSDRGNGVRDG